VITKLEFTADWMNYTAKHNDSRHSIYEYAMGINSPEWVDAIAVHGYQLAIENRLGCRVMWHTRRSEMGIHIMYSGKCLNRYRQEGITSNDIVRHHAFFGDICKRIDIALDGKDSGLDIKRLYRMLTKNTIAITKSKQYNLITGSSGDTLYIGSRTSEQFMRIYDKAAEQHQDGDWKRIELELKGSRAIEVARQYAINGEVAMVDQGKALIKGFANFPDEVWQELTGDLVAMIGKSKDETPDTYKWLLTQVAPTMARYMNSTGDPTVIEKFLAVVHSLTDMDN